MERNNWNVSFNIQEASHGTFPESAGVVSYVRLIRSLLKKKNPKNLENLLSLTSNRTDRIVFEPV